MFQEELQGGVVHIGQLAQHFSQLQDPQILGGLDGADKLVVQVEGADWSREFSEVEFDQAGHTVNVLQNLPVPGQVWKFVLVKTFLQSLNVG